MPESDTLARPQTETAQEPSFRDHIATVDQTGKRIWIYPKKPSGAFHRARAVVSILLLAFLFAAPFIRINGQQPLLFNIIERKFIIFGLAFWPQDFHLFVLATISFIVFILLFTAVFGRLWCGWACPQTVFMEMVFRKIEYWIEGDARQQKALNATPMNAEKFFKKAGKHALFVLISFFIGNLFLAYIIGSAALLQIVTQPPWAHWGGFLAVVIFTGLFYFDFAYFREQLCVLLCPYGRFQSVLLDQNSIVVSYDFKRGEPRGRYSRKQPSAELGDCVDCRLCVDVCPTGIDIRNGTELECINCTACMDACNNVMQKLNRPRGLIRYASYNGIVAGAKRLFTPRTLGYSAVLLALVIALAGLTFSRSEIEATILRTPGALYQKTTDGDITNLYSVRIINKTFEPISVTLRLLSPAGEITLIGGKLEVQPDALAETAFLAQVAPEQLQGIKTDIRVGVYAGDTLIDTIKSSFIGPAKE